MSAPTPEPLTPDAALVRLRQYGTRTSTWSTATYADGTERALADIARALAGEVTRLRAERSELNEMIRSSNAAASSARAALSERPSPAEVLRKAADILADTNRFEDSVRAGAAWAHRTISRMAEEAERDGPTESVRSTRPTLLTAEQRAQIASRLREAETTATNALLVDLAEAVGNCRAHAHPKYADDIFCENLTGYISARVGPVLRRLVDVEAEAERLRAELAARPSRATVLREAAPLFTTLQTAPSFWLADHADDNPTLHTSLEAARAGCDASYGSPAEWQTDHDGVHRQVVTHPDDDRAVRYTGRVVWAISVEPETSTAGDPR